MTMVAIMTDDDGDGCDGGSWSIVVMNIRRMMMADGDDGGS